MTSAASSPDRFATVFGSARGRVENDTLLSQYPTSLARAERLSFFNVDAADWPKAAGLIDMCDRNRALLPERPLLADLHPHLGALALHVVWDELFSGYVHLLEALGLDERAAREAVGAASTVLSGSDELQDLFAAGGHDVTARMRERAVGLCEEALTRRYIPLNARHLALLFYGTVPIGPGGFTSLTELNQLNLMFDALSPAQCRALMETALNNRGQSDSETPLRELRNRVAPPCARRLLDDRG